MRKRKTTIKYFDKLKKINSKRETLKKISRSSSRSSRRRSSSTIDLTK